MRGWGLDWRDWAADRSGGQMGAWGREQWPDGGAGVGTEPDYSGDQQH